MYERMLPQARLRFLLADDAGAGKTIMTGLYIRESLSRRTLRRVLVVAPAGLVGNLRRELAKLFQLCFRVVVGSDADDGNPFASTDSDLVIVSIDSLRGPKLFEALRGSGVEPYDLVVFDEAHKLSASRDPDGTFRPTDRYRLAEALSGVRDIPDDWRLSWSAPHLLLLGAALLASQSPAEARHTEARIRAYASAALSSSVWLVCRKRDPMTKAGWDAQVIKDMQSNITTQLRRFWDDGIRGPDFVWAATGPALEAYSRYPAVKKASEPGALMGVDEFLRQVRRIVVDFVVGRVLTRGQDGQAVGDHPLDDLTTYYLLHRNDFGMKDAPAGPCILYMVSCNLAERDLLDQYEILAKGGQAEAEDLADDVGDDDADASGGSGGKFKLKPWASRKHRSLGLEIASGRSIPLIDQVHKLMQLWVAGDTVKVNDYLDQRGLRHSHVFAQLIQALIETSRAEGINDECSVLERLANHLKSVGVAAQPALGLE